MTEMPAAFPIDRSWRRLAPDGGGSARSTDGELVYAIGDIHGCYDLLKALLGEIVTDADAHAAGRRPILILCGDYIDRGPKSADVLEAIVWLQRHAGHDIHALMGNHERALLDFLDRPAEGAGWLGFGGEQTLRSYGVEPPADGDDPSEMARARDELLDRMPAAHLDLLNRLELLVEVGDYVFVHAGIRPRVPLDQQNADDLLWIRRDFLDFQGVHPRMVIHGHSWKDGHPQVRANRIGIDTGAYSTDVLTGLRLDGADIHYIQAEADGI